MERKSIPLIVRHGDNEGSELYLPCSSITNIYHLHQFLMERFGDKNFRLHRLHDKPISLCSHSLHVHGNELIKNVFPFSKQIPISCTEHGSTVSVRVRGRDADDICTLHTSDSVSLLKHLTTHSENTRSEVGELSVYIDGSQEELNENQTLFEAGITQFSSVLITSKVIGGASNSFPMVDVFNDSAIRIINLEPAPVWRRIYPGFSLHGTCMSSTCVVAKGTVYWSNRMGVFNYNTALKLCPMCKLNMNVKSYGFYRCFYTIRGINADQATEHHIPWRRVGDVYQTWCPETSGVRNWSFVQIITRPLELARTVPDNPKTKEAPIADNCGICMTDMRYGRREIRMLSCCHSFHTDCYNRWELNEATKNTKRRCPDCGE